MMKEVVVDGQVFRVPADTVTAPDVRGLVNAQPDDVVVLHHPNGQDEVLSEHQTTRVEPGSQFVTMPGYVSG
jgi:hypothetical protein